MDRFFDLKPPARVQAHAAVNEHFVHAITTSKTEGLTCSRRDKTKALARLNKEIDASQGERLGRSCLSIARSAFSLALSAQAERDNESYFFRGLIEDRPSECLPTKAQSTIACLLKVYQARRRGSFISIRVPRPRDERPAYFACEHNTFLGRCVARLASSGMFFFINLKVHAGITRQPRAAAGRTLSEGRKCPRRTASALLAFWPHIKQRISLESNPILLFPRFHSCNPGLFTDLSF
ncbi:hypothetical protein EVAR_90576_1 [Eumeta japonica]|uniref:Uncharacterized protein n=1 Tax=Eumeta variegata TaxID=151549 RepID=A0A4C1YWE7_EUMVA|nr:hypothetical protein EVAR_90576_1 [Eumeta japonica]